MCIHGLTHHGGVFDAVGRRLAAQGHFVMAVDLRGHGGSGFEPPWRTETHIEDILETLESAGVQRATWIGHSYGGRLAATLADLETQRTSGVVLLDTTLQVSPKRALQSAEIERLDWSFASIDGVIAAVLSSDSMASSPREVVAEFVKGNVEQGPDGRFRLRVCPSAVVVAWSEITLPPPPIAQLRTLIVRAAKPLFDGSAQDRQYEETLGDLVTLVEVPNGHNLLWESPTSTIEAIESFIGPAAKNETIDANAVLR